MKTMLPTPCSGCIASYVGWHAHVACYGRLAGGEHSLGPVTARLQYTRHTVTMHATSWFKLHSQYASLLLSGQHALEMR